MKIGILTHHYINNFGAFLQAYALQEAVQQMYPQDEVVMINAINLKHFIINTGGWFRFLSKEREPESLAPEDKPATYLLQGKKAISEAYFKMLHNECYQQVKS